MQEHRAVPTDAGHDSLDRDLYGHQQRAKWAYLSPANTTGKGKLSFRGMWWVPTDTALETALAAETIFSESLNLNSGDAEARRGLAKRPCPRIPSIGVPTP